ncbi:MAG TPA: hypothetical protein VGF75_00280 [Candidatus Saccharimonadales bacterium]|jgi:hypothetical protein
MKTFQVVVNTVIPSQYAAYAAAFRAEGFDVTAAGLADMTAQMGRGLTVKASYNRNQQVVTASVSYSEWQPGLSDDFLKTNVLRVLGKSDMTGKVQSTPVMTPLGKTGQPLSAAKSVAATTKISTAPLPAKPAVATKPVGPTTAADVHALVEKIKAEQAASKAGAAKPATIVPPPVVPKPATPVA